MKDGLEYFTDTELTVVALMIFFWFFVGLLVWISLKGNKENYKQIEKIPLAEGDVS